mgnify:CR=1 FL=1|jgi:hypothetical protein
MTRDEITLRLLLLKPILEKPRAYQPAETVEIYAVYNALTGEKKAPNGCGACLNTVLTRLKKEIRTIENGQSL